MSTDKKHRDPLFTTAADNIEAAAQAHELRWTAGELSALAEAREELETLIAMSVGRARAAGETWAQIAASLGVTRQAAQQRYGN